MKKPLKKIVILSLAAVLLAGVLLTGCGKSGREPITSLSQLNEKGRLIAVSQSAPEEALVRDSFSEATILTYTDIIPAYGEVANGKLDACISQRTEMRLAIENGARGVRLLEENYCENTIAVGISKRSPIPDLKSKINTFLGEIRDDGTLDDMFERWVIEEKETMPEIPKPERPAGKLRVATTGTNMPYTYYIGHQLAGYDIELARRFASWLGMDLALSVYSWDGILSVAQGGDVDCIMSNLYYTEEHEEAIDFSDAIFKVEITAMVKDDGSGTTAGESGEPADGKQTGTAVSGFLRSIAESFEKTFIRESRWKLLLHGSCTTLFITVLSVMFGTILGFVVYVAWRQGNPIANTVTRFCVWLVQGMPVVVFLMILYYVIFGRVSISGTWVSVIAFSLIFGASVHLMLKAGVEAVDTGQAEAAYALGYMDPWVFLRVVLPQALPHILPRYAGEVTMLIKSTAVVGYIAVEDLTKMGDIIRSRTYEAFFPLIAVAVIYFILSGILGFGLRRISRLLDPRQRRYGVLLKGVKTRD